MTLTELNIKNKYLTDKEFDHSYLSVYDELFAPYQNEKINVLEAGIHRGGSIKLWEDYFPNAHIYGIDIDDSLISYNYSERVTILIKNVIYLREDNFLDFPITIAIDDSSHRISHQFAFIEAIYPKLTDNGIIIIEDIQDIENSHWAFERLGCKIIDLRKVKKQYDDVLAILRK